MKAAKKQNVGEKWGADSNSTAASAIAELMRGWNKIEAAAKLRFPGASKEEIYQICKGAMNHALNIRG